MNDADVLVVGSGLSGLLSAVFAARRGHAVRLLYRGHGAIGIGGGTLDVLGYAPGVPCALVDPLENLTRLPADHPYSLAGPATVREALNAFLDLTAQCGFAHTAQRTGDVFRNTTLLTSAGTAKPSCIVPPTMTMTGLQERGEVLIIGFEGLKDIHPRLMVQGFSRLKSLKDKRLTSVTLNCPPDLCQLSGALRSRDLSTLDLARYFESPQGYAWLAERLRAQLTAAPDAVFLLPPVLGLSPSAELHAQLERDLERPVHEVLAPPPSVTGLRLRAMLLAELARLGVSVVANATMTGARINGGRCEALTTDMAGRTLDWSAKQFIIATGGIYGEGLLVSPDSVSDAIFADAIALTPALNPSMPDWSGPQAYPDVNGGQSHGFARMGAAVNADFQPLDASGKPVCANVRYVGRAVGGYDFAAEKSGNGVALVSAFVAASRV